MALPTDSAMMNNDDGPRIHFSDEEKAGLSNADKVLPILIPVAKACYRFLNPAKLRMDNRTCITWFINSVDCAMQVTQRTRREGPVDLATLILEIDIPHIENTLPVLVKGFKQTRSVWDDAEPFYSRAMSVLCLIGIKMYPGGLDEDGVAGYRDIFDDDDSGSSSLVRLWP